FVAKARGFAVALLLARHWPEQGDRQTAAGAGAGFLCYRGVDPDFIATIIEAAARIAGDEESAKRVDFARRTVKRFQSRAPITGGHTLADLIGEAVVARLRKFLPIEDPVLAKVSELNERFAIVSVSRKVVVMETWPDGSVKEL